MNRKWRVISIVCWLFIIAVELYEMATTKEGATLLRVFTVAGASFVILATVIGWREGEKNRS
jgi:hypothetical protein